MPLLGAYGRALAETGDTSRRWSRSITRIRRTFLHWCIVNVQGAVLDQMGRHADGRTHYASALKIVPDEPSGAVEPRPVLPADQAYPEKRRKVTLRRAVAQPNAGPKVRQNLALVVGLRGNFAEAEKIATAEPSESQATANVAYLRQMLAQKGDWKKMGRSYVSGSNAGS